MFSRTKRDLTKLATSAIVYTAVFQTTNLVMNDALNPQSEESARNLELGSCGVGFMTMWITKPVFDRAVDRVYDWREARKIRKTENTFEYATR